MSQGYSNADIAKTLFISVATVRKHMENIFNRTQVRTRGAAAALALPHALFAGQHHAPAGAGPEALRPLGGRAPLEP